MKKSLSKIILVGSGNGLNAFLGLVFLAAVAKKLSLTDFGVYALLTSVLVAVSKLTDFGSNSVFVAKSIASSDTNLKDIYFSLKIIALSIAIPIGIIILWSLGLAKLEYLLIFTLGTIAYTISYFLYGFFQKLQAYSNIVAINTIPAIIKGVFAGLILFNVLHANVVLTYTVFSLSIFGCVFQYYFLPKELKTYMFTLEGVKRFFLQTAPAGISQIINEGWPAINNTVAKLVKGFSDAGIFSLANKISTVFSIISLSIFTVLLPKTATGKKDGHAYNFKEVAFICAAVFAFALAAGVISRYLILGFFGQKFSASIPLLEILIFSSAFTSIHSFMEHYFLVEERTKYLMGINIFKLSVFSILAIFLVPSLELYGLAWANLISSALGLIIIMVSVKKDSKFKLVSAI